MKLRVLMRYLGVSFVLMGTIFLTSTVGVDFIQDSQEGIIDLAESSLEMVMTSGGDERIIISPGSVVNRSFTGPFPTTGIIPRSSTTSSSTSVFGFEAAEKLFDELRNAQERDDVSFFPSVMSNIRTRIKRLWAVGSTQPCHVITTPSGSDAEMIPTAAALVRHPSWKLGAAIGKTLVTNIIIASGEVGAGTIPAAGLRHVNSLTSVGGKVLREQPIDGVDSKVVRVVELKIRDDKGQLFPAVELEGRIIEIVRNAIDDGQYVVLHMVNACKTGFGAPRETFVRSLKQHYKDRLVVVVDAAQLRMDEQVVKQWLNNGFWTMLTGSKFLAGPVYSGAFLVPHNEALLLEKSVDFPTGLRDYFTQCDCDDFFVNFKKSLSKKYNYGLALRWEAALAEADRFFAIDGSRRDRAISLWCRGARFLVRSAKNLTLLDDLVPSDLSEESRQSLAGKCNSVISFGVRVASADGVFRYLDMLELRKMQELVWLDLSSACHDFSDEEIATVTVRGLIGQPVQIGTQGFCNAVVRLSTSVPEMYKVIRHERADPVALIENILSDDQLLIKKLDFIASRWDYFAQLKMT